MNPTMEQYGGQGHDSLLAFTGGPSTVLLVAAALVLILAGLAMARASRRAK